MTTHFASYDEPTVRRQAVLEAEPPRKSGWVVSGLAAVLAASALVVVGNLAIHQFAATLGVRGVRGGNHSFHFVSTGSRPRHARNPFPRPW